MRKEDTIISYRPDAAKLVREGMENMLKLYSQDQRGLFYKIVALYMEGMGDSENAALLNEASALVLSGEWGDEEKFYEEYEEKLNHVVVGGVEYALGNITQVEAFINMASLYKDFVEEIRKKVDTEGFSKSEKFAFDKVISVIESPLRNPNAKVNGYYMNGHAHEFPRQMKSQVEFIRKEVEQTLSLWETPDEEEELDR